MDPIRESIEKMSNLWYSVTRITMQTNAYAILMFEYTYTLCNVLQIYSCGEVMDYWLSYFGNNAQFEIHVQTHTNMQWRMNKHKYSILCGIAAAA